MDSPEEPNSRSPASAGGDDSLEIDVSNFFRRTLGQVVALAAYQAT